ncbi:MAG: hypothetical protein KGV59_04400 [Tenacibaculum sp.]|nr:hypothetical protein [Tenacibaculum sp.]
MKFLSEAKGVHTSSAKPRADVVKDGAISSKQHNKYVNTIISIDYIKDETFVFRVVNLRI